MKTDCQEAIDALRNPCSADIRIQHIVHDIASLASSSSFHYVVFIKVSRLMIFIFIFILKGNRLMISIKVVCIKASRLMVIT